jgi:hypothetical protein
VDSQPSRVAVTGGKFVRCRKRAGSEPQRIIGLAAGIESAPEHGGGAVGAQVAVPVRYRLARPE